MVRRPVPRISLTLAAMILTSAGVAAAVAYNSEEHKLIADRGAGLVDEGSAELPWPTRFLDLDATQALKDYKYAKSLSVGIESNAPSQYSEDTKKIQDNSYWTGYDQRDWNLNIHIPFGETRPRTLVVNAWLGSNATFTFGELVALYGDYRRTVHCVAGRCYLTNRDAPQYRVQLGTRQAHTIYFEYGNDCFGPLDCGWRPDPVPNRSYLRAIGSGLVPPFGFTGNTFSNTAYADEELDAGWWGDEMLRIANVNDWHFATGAVAWYVGMHRLALLYVEAARTDTMAWNQALHYEASALHSLTDLFAFGHIVTNRDRTSYGIMYDEGLLSDPAYDWMENVLVMGGGVRTPERLNGRLNLATTLPPIGDVATSRNDFMPSYRGTWAPRAKTEHDYHDEFNGSGATVMNLRRQEFVIYGDSDLRTTSGATQAIIAEAVRASLQSLFDAYESGETAEQMGSMSSNYWDALLNIPVYVKSHPEHMFDGQWTRFAAAVDLVAGAGIVPADASLCTMPYVDGDVSLPAPVSGPCVIPSEPDTAAVVADLLSGGGSLGKGDRVHLDDEGNRNGGYDVGDFLAWVRAQEAAAATPASPSAPTKGGRP